MCLDILRNPVNENTEMPDKKKKEKKKPCGFSNILFEMQAIKLEGNYRAAGGGSRFKRRNESSRIEGAAL